MAGGTTFAPTTDTRWLFEATENCEQPRTAHLSLFIVQKSRGMRSGKHHAPAGNCSLAGCLAGKLIRGIEHPALSQLAPIEPPMQTHLDGGSQRRRRGACDEAGQRVVFVGHHVVIHDLEQGSGRGCFTMGWWRGRARAYDDRTRCVAPGGSGVVGQGRTGQGGQGGQAG